MKKAVIWAFVFVVLVLLVAQAIQSNRDELTHQFALRIDLSILGTYQIPWELSVAAYFILCIILGGFAVMILSLGAVIKANRLAKHAQQDLAECEIELRRLRGPAEDDPVYRVPPPADEFVEQES